MKNCSKHNAPCGVFRWEQFLAMELSLGVLATLLGLAGIAGWALDIPALKHVFLGGDPMRANAAVALAMLGLASTTLSAGLSRPGPLVVIVLVAAAGFIGGGTLIEHLFSRDFGIDDLFFQDREMPFEFAPKNRMSPAAAYCLVSIAASLASFLTPKRLHMRLPFAAVLSTTVAVIGSVVIVHIASSGLFGFHWGPSPSIVAPTAVAFLALSVAVLLRVRRLQKSKWALGYAGTTGFLFGAALLIGSAEMGSGFARDIKTTGLRIESSQAILQQLAAIRTALGVLEAAQGIQPLLVDEKPESRRALRALVLGHIEKLSTDARLSAFERQQLGGLQQDVQGRFQYVDEVIAVARTQGVQTALLLLTSGKYNVLNARITLSLESLLQPIRERLIAEQVQLGVENANIFMVLPISSFLGLVSLVGGLYFVEYGAGKRRRAEQALTRSLAEFRVMVDSLAEGARVVDQNQHIVEANLAGAGVHGLVDSASTLDARWYGCPDRCDFS